MPRKRIGITVIMTTWFVDKMNVSDGEFRGDVDIQPAIYFFRHDIVVAHYQVKTNMRKLPSPYLEIVHFLVFMAVEHISGDDNLFWLIARDEALQAEEIFSSNPCWHCNAGFPEMCSLAQMEI